MRRSLICRKFGCILLTGLLLGGCQKEEAYLPEAENDFIWTVIGE